jgi:hypothetical protein
MDIPKDKAYPPDAGQCDNCGGNGCQICGLKGWLPSGHPKIRRCLRSECLNVIRPDWVAVYCGNRCALQDA